MNQKNVTEEIKSIKFLFGGDRQKRLSKYLSILKKANENKNDFCSRKQQIQEEMCLAILIQQTLEFCSYVEKYSNNLDDIKPWKLNSRILQRELDFEIQIPESMYNFFYMVWGEKWQDYCIRMIRHGIDEIISQNLLEVKTVPGVSPVEITVMKLSTDYTLSTAEEVIHNINDSSINWNELNHLLREESHSNRMILCINRIYKEVTSEYPNLKGAKTKADIKSCYRSFNSKKLDKSEHIKLAKEKYLKEYIQSNVS